MNAAKKDQWEKRRLEFSEKRALAAAARAMPPGLTVASGKPGASSGRLLYGVDLGVPGTDRTQFLVLQQRGGKTAAMNAIAEELRAQGRSVTVLEPAGSVVAAQWAAKSSDDILADMRNATRLLAEKSSFRQSMLGSWPAEPRVTLEPDEVWGESPLRAADWAVRMAQVAGLSLSPPAMPFYDTFGDYRENHEPVRWSTAAIAKALCNISPEIRRVTMVGSDGRFALTVWGENGAPVPDDIFQCVRAEMERRRPVGIVFTVGNAA